MRLFTAHSFLMNGQRGLTFSAAKGSGMSWITVTCRDFSDKLFVNDLKVERGFRSLLLVTLDRIDHFQSASVGVMIVLAQLS